MTLSDICNVIIVYSFFSLPSFLPSFLPLFSFKATRSLQLMKCCY